MSKTYDGRFVFDNRITQDGKFIFGDLTQDGTPVLLDEFPGIISIKINATLHITGKKVAKSTIDITATSKIDLLQSALGNIQGYIKMTAESEVLIDGLKIAKTQVSLQAISQISVTGIKSTHGSAPITAVSSISITGRKKVHSTEASRMTVTSRMTIKTFAHQKQEISLKSFSTIRLLSGWDKSDYEVAIISPTRQVTARVEIDFPNEHGGYTTAYFENDEIFSMNLLEESSVLGTNPLGFISANELTLSLDNHDRRFTPSNSERQYDVIPGLEVRPFLTVKLTGVDAEIPLGTYWCNDWDTHSDSLVATTVAHDRLMGILNKDTPQIPVMVGTTIAEMFNELMRYLDIGVENYEINATLNQPVRLGWWFRDKLRRSLQTLTEAGNCYITVTRDDKIKAMPNFTTGPAIALLTDNTSIFSINNPQRILDVYTAIKLQYWLPYIKEPDDSLLRIDNVLVPANSTGANVFITDRMDFRTDDIPIMRVDWVYLYSSDPDDPDAQVKSYIDNVEHIKYGATDIVLPITNEEAVDEEVNIKVKGVGCGHHLGHRITHVDDVMPITGAIKALGHKELALENHLVQSQQVAKAHSETLMWYVSDATAHFDVKYRGDPTLQVGDIIEIESATNKIERTKVMIIEHELTYDGGLTGRIRGRRVYDA